MADPEDGERRTRLVPMPGGRLPEGRPAAGEPGQVRPLELDLGAVGVSRNPLLRASAALCAVATHLRQMARHDAIDQLRLSLIEEVRRFTVTARQLAARETDIGKAEYILATLVDEAVLGTPWGHASNWGQRTVSAAVVHDTHGGDAFFSMLDEARQRPHDNIDLLELQFVCLKLGFAGKYSLLRNGRAQLLEIEEELYRIIRAQRGDADRSLSPAWQGMRQQGYRIARFVPLWLFPLVAVCILVAFYVPLRLSLGAQADKVAEKIVAVPPLLRVPVAAPPVAAPRRSMLAARVRARFPREVASRLIEVNDNGMETSILVHSDLNLFPSGAASISSLYDAIFRGLAAELRQEPGPIQVIGHSDSQAISNWQFPSNMELSRARAQAVLDRLVAEGVDGGKLSARGRGALEPLAGNETEEGRARNRRIELLVTDEVAP